MARSSRGNQRSSERGWWHLYLEQHRRAAGLALSRFKAQPIGNLLTVVVLSLAIAMPTGLYLLLKNIDEVSAGWATLNEITVMLDYQSTEAQAMDLAEEVRSMDGVDSVRAISPDQALDEFKRNAADAAALDALDANPLPWVLAVQPEPERPHEAITAMVGDLGDKAGVASATFDLDWLIRFNAWRAVGAEMIAVVAALLMFGMLLIVANTVRLDIEHEREEIEISKLLGATDGFARRPYLYLGLGYGVLASLGAALIVTAAVIWLRRPVADLAAAYADTFSLNTLGFTEVLILLAGSAILGWLGAAVAASQQLRAIQIR